MNKLSDTYLFAFQLIINKVKYVIEVFPDTNKIIKCASYLEGNSP
jgi:hypothetical protein